MDLNQLNELDFSNMGEWPGIAKAIAVVLLCVATGGAWYYFDTQHQLNQLAKAERKEKSLRQTFEEKQKKAANLYAYLDQLAQMKESFGAMLRQLPNKTEVASLLVDVSQTGLASGLEFELFRPQGEQKKEFYAELPIDIQVLGKYHEFGTFISGLASLPRIVTIHNVSIRDTKRGRDTKKKAQLTLNATVKTYRYLEEEEEQ